MPWCPVCENEYIEGITECADCHVALVESLEETKSVSNSSSDEEEIHELLAALQHSETNDDEMEKEPYVPIYESGKAKADNYKTSAYTLLIVGVAGAIFLVLMAMGMIPFIFARSISFIVYIVLGLMFVIFIILGIQSMNSYKKYAKEAVVEEQQEKEIMQWCHANLTIATVDGTDENTQRSEEEKYFDRYSKMKDMINAEFPEIDASFLEYALENLYQEIFE